MLGKPKFGKNLFRELPLLIVAGVYFVWLLANNHSVGFFVADVSAKEYEQYATPTYTFVDSTVLTGQVQKETYTQYTIGNGETISQVAVKNNLHVATILKANNITATQADFVKPGTVLLIPTEDLDSSNEWMLASNDRITKEKEAAAKVEVAKQKELAQRRLALVNTRSVIARSSSGKTVARQASQNGYPWGYCTWYVASKRAVGRWGNAGQWLSGARASGYSTGKTAQAGAIFVSNESSVGHVGVVESVSGGMMTVSEMNYEGYGRVSRRTIPVNYGKIRGFIY